MEELWGITRKIGAKHKSLESAGTLGKGSEQTILDKDSTPEKIPSETPTTAIRRRSRRGSDGFNEDPIIQREVEDSIHIDGLERVADTSNLDSANVSANQSKFHI